MSVAVAGAGIGGLTAALALAQRGFGVTIHERAVRLEEAGAGIQAYAGALVRRGEAEAEVTATGAHTKFGRTAELIRTAHVVSTQQNVSES